MIRLAGTSRGDAKRGLRRGLDLLNRRPECLARAAAGTSSSVTSITPCQGEHNQRSIICIMGSGLEKRRFCRSSDREMSADIGPMAVGFGSSDGSWSWFVRVVWRRPAPTLQSRSGRRCWGLVRERDGNAASARRADHRCRWIDVLWTPQSALGHARTCPRRSATNAALA